MARRTNPLLGDEVPVKRKRDTAYRCEIRAGIDTTLKGE